jgi:hypothetical protein
LTPQRPLIGYHGSRPLNVARENNGTVLEFTVGESVKVAAEAEDALIAALEVKYERPDAVIN